MKFKMIIEMDVLGARQLEKEVLQDSPNLSSLFSPSELSELLSESKDEKELERYAINHLNRMLSDEGLIVHQVERID